jgi:hypothetical protein
MQIVARIEQKLPVNFSVLMCGLQADRKDVYSSKQMTDGQC